MQLELRWDCWCDAKVSPEGRTARSRESTCSQGTNWSRKVRWEAFRWIDAVFLADWEMYDLERVFHWYPGRIIVFLPRHQLLELVHRVQQTGRSSSTSGQLTLKLSFRWPFRDSNQSIHREHVFSTIMVDIFLHARVTLRNCFLVSTLIVNNSML